MTPEPCTAARQFRLSASFDMKISKRIKIRRQPPTAEELAARAEAESVRDQIRENEAVLKPQIDERLGGGKLHATVLNLLQAFRRAVSVQAR